MVVGGATTGDVTLEMFNNTSGSAPADDDFHFIAIGTQ
jgi:hypothetical protein